MKMEIFENLSGWTKLGSVRFSRTGPSHSGYLLGHWSMIGYKMVRLGGPERLGDVRSFGPGSNRKLL